VSEDQDLQLLVTLRTFDCFSLSQEF